MKNIFIYLLLNITLFLSCEKSPDESCGLQVTDNTSPQILKVLFIGNSHTYVNDIPSMISFMAKSKGDSVYFEMSAPGGYDFQRHYKLKETISAIKSHNWDYVILQESGWRPALIDAMADTMIYPYADTLYSIIKTCNQSAKIILYMTHGYRDGASWGDIDPSVSTYKGMQEKIKKTYLKLSKRLNVPLAPAGVLWNIFMDKNPDINLFQSDGVHANLTGSYISACTIYSLIFKKRPENIYIPADLVEEDARKIQDITSNTLFDCNPEWKNY